MQQRFNEVTFDDHLLTLIYFAHNLANKLENYTHKNETRAIN